MYGNRIYNSDRRKCILLLLILIYVLLYPSFNAEENFLFSFTFRNVKKNDFRQSYFSYIVSHGFNHYNSIRGIVLTNSTGPLLLSSSSKTAHKVQAQEQIQQQQQHQSKTAETKVVAAGGGNASAPLTLFIPQNVEIEAGQTVTLYNPTTVAEPHTVTFVLDNSSVAGVVSPLAVSNTTKFIAIPPGSNNQAVLLPENNNSNNNDNNNDKSAKNTLIGINARVYNPVVIDSSDNVKFMNPNASYNMSGTEKYVNSGWFLPKGQEQAFPGSGNTFTVTFDKPGIYEYMCILHPWMAGSVAVK
jgi:plastocyanin